MGKRGSDLRRSLHSGPRRNRTPLGKGRKPSKVHHFSKLGFLSFFYVYPVNLWFDCSKLLLKRTVLGVPPVMITTAAKRNLGKAVGKTSIPANECECQSQQLQPPHGFFWLFFFSDHCSLLTAHLALLTAHCSLLTAHCSLGTFYFIPPFSPPSGLAQQLFQEPSAKSKFLAVVGVSNAPSKCSMVLFPDPLGPVMATNSRSAISTSTASNARTANSPEP